MARYIDADALKDYIARMSSNGDYVESVWWDIDHAPTADVVEVRRGKWTHDGSKWANRFICSECGYKLFDEPTNFCPNCGADMRGEEDEG